MQLRALTFNIKTGALSSPQTIGAIIARKVRELTPADHAQARDASDHVPVLAEYELGV